MMNYQSKLSHLDVPGAALYVSLPGLVPQVGWLLINAEAKDIGSMEPMKYHLSPGDSVPLLPTNSVEDMFYSQSYTHNEPKTLVSPFKARHSEGFDFDDFNFLPSSPESIDFADLAEMDTEMLTLNFGNVCDQVSEEPEYILKSSNTIKVDADVEDPEVALNLLHQLSDNRISQVNSENYRHAFNPQFIPVNVLPTGDTSLVSMQTPISLANKPLAATTNATPFHIESFFTLPCDTQLDISDNVIDGGLMEDTVRFGFGSGTVMSSTDTSTLSEFLLMPDKQKVSPPLSPSSFSSGVSHTPDSFGDEQLKKKHWRPVKPRPEKKERKKEQNKTAALKYRQKKRSEHGSFLNECEETERKNTELKLRVAEITREINYLKSLLLEISIP